MAITTELVPVGKSAVLRAVALNAVVATGDNDWVDVSGCRNFSLHVTGITTATVVVTGSNALTAPATSTHGIEIATVTANALVTVGYPVHWVKARCTAWTSGTVSVFLEGVMP